MRDVDFLSELLRVDAPWKVASASLDRQQRRVDVQIEWCGPGKCATCGGECPKYDHRERTWRDLDLCADQLYLHAMIPRTNCPEHGILTVEVPWASGRSEFTSRFERLAIALLGEMSIAGVARNIRVSWDQIDGVMERAVKRGVARREERIYRFIGIDEKSIKKGHKYFTIVSDLESGQVIWIGRGRKREVIDGFWKTLSPEQLNGIEGIAMDMWQPFFDSAMAHVPDAKKKIVFDRFHIVKHLLDAVDTTRKSVMHDLEKSEAASLKGTKYDWLRNKKNMEHGEKIALAHLRSEYGKLGRAWMLKELFSKLWEYQRESAARTFFKDWYSWATRSQLSAIIKFARMVKGHFENIITYLHLKITNAAAEGLNSKIQWIKYMARGFRNEGRFERAILFHCGGLDLFPTHYKF